ncbi:MAG TPA: hypothetical protein VE091_03580 [Gemmatimonadales bacterium]|jgi:hypothetical protein|nr:hypothetical protein [Gemmatimonadales bacterium]
MPSLSGLPEVPCAKCGKRVPGLAWTELCPECRWEREARARRLSSRVALAATALMGLYLMLRLPATPGLRLYAVIAVIATYIIVRRIASRLAMEFLPR